MTFLRKSLMKWLSIFFGLVTLFFFAFTPTSVIALDSSLSPEVIDVVTIFSGKFCTSVSKGNSAEDASKGAIREMISSLIFSGLLKELMLIPKEEMAFYVASTVFNKCGNDIAISQEEYNKYLLVLADDGPSQRSPKPFQPFGIG